MANGHMRECRTLILVRKVQVKTTVKYHLTLVRRPSSEIPQVVNAGKVVGKKELCYTVDGNVNWWNH